MRNQVVHQNTFINSSVKMEEEFYGFSCYCKSPPLRVVASFPFAGPKMYKELMYTLKSQKKGVCPKGLLHLVQHMQSGAGRQDLASVPSSATDPLSDHSKVSSSHRGLMSSSSRCLDCRMFKASLGL